MIIYPAIDILGGKCVRLTQGDYDKSIVYSESPADVAKRWEQQGAEFLHMVDLDGARKGIPINAELVKEVLNAVNIPVQLGGGIRTAEDVDMYIQMGVARVILGTSAVEKESFIKEIILKHKEKIAVGIDAKNGFAATDGWEKVSDLTALDLAAAMERCGVETIIYTDIATDGMLLGPNLQAMENMAKAVAIDVIASGGVSTADDIKSLKSTGVGGVIIGKALYSGNLTLEESLCYAKE